MLEPKKNIKIRQLSIAFSFSSVFFVIIFGLSGCKEPSTNDSSLNSKKIPYLENPIEFLGTIDPVKHAIKTMSINSYGLNSTIQNNPTTYQQIDLQLDWNNKVLNYNLECSQNQFTGKVPIPQSIMTSLQNTLSQAEICRKTFTINDGEMICLAAMVPLAQIEFADGDFLSLSPQSNPICPQNIDYFCNADDQNQFTQLGLKLIALVPSCNP